MKEPKTREEWQAAVDAARGALMLHSARCYGLITGGPEINVARCQEILTRGAEFGVKPNVDAALRFVSEIIAQQSKEAQAA